MKTLTLYSRLCVCVSLFLVLACPSPSWAQSVFKCTVGGKTIYQSSACAGQGKELEIPHGPSEQQIQEAKSRADAEKARTSSPLQSSQQGTQNQPVAAKADCARLNKERADAFGLRNATVRSSRESNLDQSASVDRAHDNIRRIERQMVIGGCSPT